MYQISKYPSSENSTEKAFVSHSGGTKTSKVLGIVNLHPVDGRDRETRASLTATESDVGSSASVGFVCGGAPDSNMRARTGSSVGSRETSSSESSRKRPEESRYSQAKNGSLALVSQGTRSDKYFGSRMRLPLSATKFANTTSAISYQFLPVITSKYHGYTFEKQR